MGAPTIALATKHNTEQTTLHKLPCIAPHCQIHPARTSCCNMLKTAFPSLGSWPVALRVCVGLGLSLTMYLVAFFVTDLGLLFAIIGATGSTLICYTLPGGFYTFMMRGYGWPPLRIASLLQTLLSVPLMACGLAAVIEKGK